MTARTLMVMGASSSAGKSLLCTALGRVFTRRGLTVLPFKAQNMSNNAAVCAGGEIGRAQAEQAWACNAEPEVEMNPILLKPEADHRSQCVLLGRPLGSFTAKEYYAQKERLWPHITRSLDALRSRADLVVIEGAGSPVELNLMDADIVNLAVARQAGAVSLLVGDIDRGGIFAQLLGTLWLVPQADRPLFRGLVVNKFRGDLRLFEAGVRMLEERGGVKVLGVLPYLDLTGIAAEDSVSVEDVHNSGEELNDGGRKLDVAVIRLPRISNFDDFDALCQEPNVRLHYSADPADLGEPDVIILPGTKSTIADLEWLRSRGLADAVCRHAARGGMVIGICGGYQMLGAVIRDSLQVESPIALTQGLGLLPLETTFCAEKSTYRAQARVLDAPGLWQGLKGQVLDGYEIHAGDTPSRQPLFQITRREDPDNPMMDGTISADGRVFGTYLHGLFNNDTFRRAWLGSLGFSDHPISFQVRRAAAFDRLADEVEACLDLDYLAKILKI